MSNLLTSVVPAGVLLAGLVFSSTAGAAIVLLPHHATYKLTLAGTTGAKAPADANGMISYDFSGSACKGYTTVVRQVTAVEPAEGEARVSDSQTTTVESGNASRFDFDIKTTSAGDEDDVKGEAEKVKDGGDVKIRLEEPEAARLDITTPVLFPTEHLSRIIATAASGGKILAAPVFDGSDTGRKILNTLTVIGAPITTPAAEKPAQDDALKAERRWPVTISYFEQNSTDSQPSYTLSFELYENGVSRALRVDNGSFVMAGELVDFKAATEATCH